jgi:hypothetical protein
VNGVGGVAILLLFSACEMSTRLMVFQLAGQADAHRLGLYVVRLRRKPSIRVSESRYVPLIVHRVK